MSDDEWGSLNNSNAARSVASLKSNEHHDTSNNEDALDAMGMIHDDSIRQRHHNDTTFNDHRRVSNIQPDQRMIRPPRNYGNGKYSDPFTQQSKLLSHEKIGKVRHLLIWNMVLCLYRRTTFQNPQHWGPARFHFLEPSFSHKCQNHCLHSISRQSYHSQFLYHWNLN